MTDILGHELKLNDIVAFADRYAADIYLNIARVLSVSEQQIQVEIVRSGHSTQQLPRTLRLLKTVQVIRLPSTSSPAYLENSEEVH